MFAGARVPLSEIQVHWMMGSLAVMRSLRTHCSTSANSRLIGTFSRTYSAEGCGRAG